METLSLPLIALALLAASPLAAPPARQVQLRDDTQLKQLIIFSRHGVRSSPLPPSTLNTFYARPFTAFNVAPGHVTGKGVAVETILGRYYRLWLTDEGLLTGNDSADAAFVYFRPNFAEAASEIGWGQWDAGAISQTLRFHTLALDLGFRTPYLDKSQSSNAVSHVVRPLVQDATGNAMTGTLGNPSSKVIVLIPSIAPLFIPGCSNSNDTFDCSLANFVTVANHSIDRQSVDSLN